MSIASFNPRARVGRDIELVFYLRNFCPVSIHAPAWGATKTLAFSPLK